MCARVCRAILPPEVPPVQVSGIRPEYRDLMRELSEGVRALLLPGRLRRSRGWLGKILHRFRLDGSGLFGFVEEFLIRTRILGPDDPLAVNEEHVGHKVALERIELQVFDDGLIVGFAERPFCTVFRGKLDRIGAFVYRAFQDSKALRLKFRIEATQNLSGELAMRSSAENQQHTEHLAAVLAHQGLVAVGERDGKFRRFAGHFRGVEDTGAEQRRNKRENKS